jgi:hypothetical protein
LHRGHLLQRACACVLCRKRVFGDDFTCVYVLARSHRVRIRVLNLHFWLVYRACATGKRLNCIVAVVWSPRKPLTLLCTSMNNKLLFSVLACTRPILCMQLWSIYIVGLFTCLVFRAPEIPETTPAFASPITLWGPKALKCTSKLSRRSANVP